MGSLTWPLGRQTSLLRTILFCKIDWSFSKEMRPSLLLSAFFCGLIQWIDAAGSVGNFRTYYHGIRGQVNILSPSQLSITNFQYDGQGPTWGTGRGTVYFWYATEGNNKRAYEANRKIIRSTGALNGRGPYRGQQITINLPAGVDANNIKWLSVWCELFNINFGDVEFSVPS